MKRRGSTRARWGRRFAVAAVVGVVVTMLSGAVGVARYRKLSGGPAAAANQSAHGAFEEGGRLWMWTAHRVAAARWAQLIAIPADADFSATLADSGVPQETPEDWRRTRALLASRSATNFSHIERLEVGWPLPAFAATHAEFDEAVPMVGGRTLEGFNIGAPGVPDWLSSRFRTWRFGWTILPTRVRCSGFAADAGFWGLLAFAGLSVPSLVGALRRRGRRKRGTCLACGYDLKGSGGKCPECGVVGE